MSRYQPPKETDLNQRLEVCEDEPIRVPGSVQRHGFLLGLDAKAEYVAVASENAEEFLRVPLKLILGARLESLFDREVMAAVTMMLMTPRTEEIQTYLGAFQIGDELCSVITHKVDERYILEFEKQDSLVGAARMNAIITNFVGLLSKLRTKEDMCRALTRQMKELTGYDRVLLYSFDDVGHGTVLSEENNGRLPSYLGLRFPASDIPRQARELYILNTTRIIPDANYVPSPLVGMAGTEARQMDLSLSVLRSVSPVHLQYMHNMGTASSMSVSIVCEGKLWGLLSGHHATSLSVPYLLRSACDMLSKLAATQIISFDTAEKLERRSYLHAVQRKILTQVASGKNFLESLGSHVGSLRDVTNAQGAVLAVDGTCVADGTVPDAASLVKIVEWLDNQPETLLFTSKLSEQLPWADEMREAASGMIAARISDVNSRYVLWFRPEVVKMVVWAGEPAMKDSTSPDTLHPRGSFASWKEIVRGQSEPWLEPEIESARDFRAAKVTIGLRRAEQAAELNEARFEQLTQTLPSIVFAMDDTGNLTYVNQRWHEAGLQPTGCWFDHGNVIDEDRARCGHAWDECMRLGIEFKEELRLRSDPAGVERWYLVHIVPFVTRHEGRGGWVGSCTDLTERREREAALRMTEKLALTGRMTSVIAHEINNPLESITNLMYLLRTEVSKVGPAADYIALAESELLRISGITKQTLRWNRETTGAPERSIVGALFSEVLRLFAGKIRNRQVKVTIRTGEEVSIYGTSGQLLQVIANLVSNAVDAANVGGNVWLSATETETGAVIEVEDDGIGINAKVQAQLFKPFFSTKGDLGNGLGLYISKEIAERHGGELSVESTVGAGTTFRFSLPAAPGV
ncbi:ATP-binding protein [Terriglobus saanensis]|uniref:histidine kinase n=1 Tax=Terriglobus saanensis (strain ATCC BAA-1853 / DSM 23119 / SP1PR4) TaxID=401053 RepID=E8V8N7_TERSS|nr:ATP-binding protein [Terriglobus saanensis]ADV84074.1 multi-sensor signal transduction histidine kinase [Terriglobus saanensis SP1PR4]